MPRRNSKVGRPKKRVFKPSSASSTKHMCCWPGCTQLVDGRVWGCTPHTKTLPIDLRQSMYKAWGPPKLVYFPRVQGKIETWVKNQHPANYPGIPFPASQGI